MCVQVLKLIENAHVLACVLSTLYLYILVYIDVCVQVLKLIENAHVLACAPSNAAADLLAERLLEHLPASSSLLRMCAYSRDLISVPASIRVTKYTMQLSTRSQQESGLARYISPIYIIDIQRIYIGYFRSKILDVFYIFNLYGVLKIFFNVTHCGYVLIFSLCVLLAYDLCPQHFLSVGQLLSDFTSPQQCSVNDKSTSPNIQCTHTHTYYYLVVNFI